MGKIYLEEFYDVRGLGKRRVLTGHERKQETYLRTEKSDIKSRKVLD